MTMKEGPCFQCLLFIFMIPFATFFFLTLSAFKVGEDYGTPLEYFCLENPMDGGAW